jgi:hypothetical protein
MTCSIRGCLEQGRSLLSYKGNDGNLYFCAQHFEKMADTYFEYKNIELECGKALHGCWPLSPADCGEYAQQLDWALCLRKKFQKCLDADLQARSYGHQTWMNYLEARINDLREDAKGRWQQVRLTRKKLKNK